MYIGVSKYAQSVVPDADWVVPSNAQGSPDNQYSFYWLEPFGNQTAELHFENFNFNLPPNAYIGGIKATIHKFQARAFNTDIVDGSKVRQVQSGPSGSVSWSNLQDALVNDAVFSEANIDSDASKFLIADKFNHNIPSGADIRGVLFRIGRQSDIDDIIKDNFVFSVKNGIIQSNFNMASGQFYASFLEEIDYGGIGASFNQSWTPSDINASGFGVAISVTGVGAALAQIDYIQSIIYYSLSGVTNITDGSIFIRKRLMG
jgi:hypothetical protein